MASTHGIYHTYGEVLSQFGFRANAINRLDKDIILKLLKADLDNKEEINKILAPCGKTYEDIAW